MMNDMVNFNPKNEARKLYLAGDPVERVAQKLDLHLATVEKWRDEEDWNALRDFIEAQIRAKQDDEAAEADDRAILMATVIENFAGKSFQQRATSMTPSELQKLASAVKTAREVRDDVRTTRLDRFYRRKRARNSEE